MDTDGLFRGRRDAFSTSGFWLGVLRSFSQPFAGPRGEGGGSGPHSKTKSLTEGGGGVTWPIVQSLQEASRASVV